jgi:hypothetical protein
MSGGPDAASLEVPSEDGGSGEWHRIFNRVEALLPRVEELAAGKARRDSSGARDNALQARLRQVSRRTSSFLSLGF